MSSQDAAIDPEITAEEEYVIGRLDEMGFRAEKLARTAERKTCDLLAADDANRYLIEVKRRRSASRSLGRFARKERPNCSITRWASQHRRRRRWRTQSSSSTRSMRRAIRSS